GADVQTDEQIDAFVREKVESAYHPSCSCKMGAENDPMEGVDPQTRVRGLEGLRVVDSSIMPTVTTGNLNAPTIMLAEKAADHILGKRLPPDDAPYYQASNWQHSQRCGLPDPAGLLGVERRAFLALERLAELVEVLEGAVHAYLSYGVRVGRLG